MRLAGIMALSCLAFGQDTPTFKSGVSLVHVDAEVTAPDGRILNGFTKDDFRVLDDGKEQPILHFSAGEEPLDLILLFDISGSMRPEVQEVASAAHAGMEELRQGDRVAVMVFNSKARTLAPFTSDLEAVRRTIEDDLLGLRFGGATLIQSAVSAAAQRFMSEKRTERRRAVLIITDNMGQRSRKESTVVSEMWEADALLTGLIVGGGSKAQALRAASTILNPTMLLLQVGVKGIAEKTGGDFIQTADPGAGFQAAMRRIRTRYSLYYGMPESKPGAHRAVKIELTGEAAKQHPKARVRARTGYVTPSK